MGLGLGGGPRKEPVTASLSPVGPQQMAHAFHPQGPPPNGPVLESTPVQQEPGGPMQAPNPVGTPGKGGGIGAPPGLDQEAFRSAMLRRINSSGANPGMPPGRPPVGADHPGPSDIKGLLQGMMASRNSRRVLGAAPQ